MSMHVPNQFRVRRGVTGSDDSAGNNGAFLVPNRVARSVGRAYSTREQGAVPLRVIASDQGGWEHVSVSLPTRCPTWDEMSFVKGLFWSEEDCVVQFHPPRSEYVNLHPFCLHMWRPVGADIPLPPSWMVGPKT
jgi:hypothetical protein